jgi:hypothetical protein
VVFSVLVGCAVINALANVIRILVNWGGWFFRTLWVKNALRRERSAICISNTRNIFYAPYFPELAEKYAGFAT